MTDKIRHGTIRRSFGMRHPFYIVEGQHNGFIITPSKIWYLLWGAGAMFSVLCCSYFFLAMLLLDIPTKEIDRTLEFYIASGLLLGAVMCFYYLLSPKVVSIVMDAEVVIIKVRSKWRKETVVRVQQERTKLAACYIERSRLWKCDLYEISISHCHNDMLVKATMYLGPIDKCLKAYLER
jgi:hypothetical protein